MKDYYRKATIQDIDEVMKAVEDSRETLRLQGNGQWQDGYPNRDDFLNDIKNGRLFVVFDEDDPKIVVGVCALTYEEEDYGHLYEGKWLTDWPYMVMHRVALKKEYRNKGYGKKLFDVFVEQVKIEGIRSLRIDTHEGNGPMRHLIELYGFVLCGKAILTPNKDRLVYERVLKEEEMLRLEAPSKKYARSYQEAIEEEDRYSPKTERIFSRREDYLERFKQFRLGENLPEGYVSEDFMWLVDGKEFIGQISFRHKLTPALLQFGGNIGYGIRYSKWNHGYGKLMLRLGLDYCRNALRMRKVMITCNDDNYASEKVMLANGGVFGEFTEHEEDEKKVRIKKYWINLFPAIIETNRFYLREITEEDRPDLCEIFQDPENMKHYPSPYDDKMMDRLINWTLENYRKYGFGLWAIIDKKTGDFIGDCGLTMQNIDGEMLPEIGYHIKRKFHNQHYCTEAAWAVREYVFKKYAFKALYGYATKDNLPSIKVMKNNGMSYVKSFLKDGEEHVVYRVEADKRQVFVDLFPEMF